MTWTQSETIALARHSCPKCFGLGMRPLANGQGAPAPCNCVFRAIFRACYARFRQCSSKEKYVRRVSLEANPGRQRKSIWGLKNEEFVADFCLVSRRVLADDEYRLFKFHFLLGGDWNVCCQRLNIDRGNFFHAVYRVEQKLGRAFRELRPHPLFPLDEYFRGIGRQPTLAEIRIESEPAASKASLKFPLKAATVLG